MIFFITLFRYFTIVLFFTLHFFSFSQGMQTRERAHCARSVFPFIKKKKKSTVCGGLVLRILAMSYQRHFLTSLRTLTEPSVHATRPNTMLVSLVQSHPLDILLKSI